MKKSKSKETKFIATVSENKISHVERIAEDLAKDGIQVDKVSKMFGIISGKSKSSLDELKMKYGSRDLCIEPDSNVKI